MLASFILYCIGWKENIHSVPPSEKQYGIIVAYPHTCNMDGILTFLLAHKYRGFVATKADNVFLKFLTWLFGMIPIRRDKTGLTQTEQIIHFLSKNPGHFYISPEGTRKRGDKIRSGFYYIARATGYPIICGCLDYRTKKYSFSASIDVSELSYEETLSTLERYYRETGLNKGGKYPELTIPLQMNKK